METLISKCRCAKKPLVVAGCVPQGSRDLKELDGVSIVGVQQIDRVVEVVEETLKGHEVARVRTVIADGVKEIWLSSEDTGAYGRDIGVNLPILLKAIVAVLPTDGSTMLRIGMTNPPYILEHLKDIADILRHPCVFSFLHVPVQSGSDRVLNTMNREYNVGEFKMVVDTLTELVPGMQIATDIICGFPGETGEDFAQTVNLIEEYKFPQVHISQFYPRPGTPAARMKKVPSTVVKNRSRELTSVFESFTPYNGMEGKVERIWITEIATDGIHLVGHTKGYVQVLVIGPQTMLGTSAVVKITSVGRWSVFGEVIETLDQTNGNMASIKEGKFITNKCTPCSNPEEETCSCSREPQDTSEESTVSRPRKETWSEERHDRGLIRWLLRKRKNHPQKRRGNGIVSEPKGNQELARGRKMGEWTFVDRALVGGILVSLLTVVVLVAGISGFWE
ncbi:tRNA (N(6)-L-threonylcarbamoyladenosine(37)-C(2))-methylthiotransferase [Sarracenia purpurea var. burkii]